MNALLNLIRMIHENPVSRARPAAAYMRFVRFQIASRVLPLPIVVPWVDHTRLVLSTGGARGNFYVGLMEPADMSLALHLLRPEDLFVDVGANVGVYTVLASGVRKCRSISIEPLPETMRNLLDNIYLNRIQDFVVTRQIGLSSQPGVLRITSDLDSMNHVVIEGPTQNSIQIPVETMDKLLPDESPLLIKIDVEGFENEVLAGAQATLRNPNVKALIVELNRSGVRYGKSDDQTHAEILRHGFRSYDYDPFARVLTPRTGYGVHNTIYVRDLAFVAQRVESAPAVTVAGLRI